MKAIERLAKQNAAAVRLAQLASLASRIEPEVLRALRLALVRDADVSAEADVWSSSLVELRTADAIRFSADALQALHAALSPADAEATLAVLDQVHGTAPALARLQERLAFLGIARAADAEVAELLRAVLGTLVTDDARRVELSIWVLQTFPRLPLALRAHPTFLAIVFAANAQRRGTVLRDATPTDAAFRGVWGEASALFEKLGDVEIGVRRSGDRVFLRCLPQIQNPKGLLVPKTDPVVLSVDSSVQLIGAGETEVEVQSPVVTVEAIDGRSYELQSYAPAAAGARRLRWLHLSELLVQRGPFALDAVNEEGIDVVFVTGDVTMSGHSEQQFAAMSQLGRRNESAFWVPGNHDLDWSAYRDADAAERWFSDRALREQFWSREGELYAQVQHSFRSWSMRTAPGALIPGDFATSFPHGELFVGVIGLNNAFFMHSNDSAMPGQELDPRQLVAVCSDIDKWVRSHNLRILLTHYPPEFLHPAALEAFYEHIAPEGRFHLHLTGSRHGHEVATMSSGGVVWRNAPLSGSPDADQRGYTVGEFFSDSTATAAITMLPRTFTKGAVRHEPAQRFAIDLTPPRTPCALESGLWIAIDSFELADLPPGTEDLPAQLGIALARRGYSVITFGDPGGLLVASGFLGELAKDGYETGAYRLIHLCPHAPDMAGRHLFATESQQDEMAHPRADALLRGVASPIGRRDLPRNTFPGLSLIVGSQKDRQELSPAWARSSFYEALIATCIARLDNALSAPTPDPYPLRGILRRASLTLDAGVAALSDFELREHARATIDGPTADRLMSERFRPAWRLAGYFAAGLRPAPIAALEAELASCDFFHDVSTLMFATSAEQEPRAFAAVCVLLRRRASEWPEPEQDHVWFIIEEKHTLGDGLRRAKRLMELARAFERQYEDRSGPQRTEDLDALVDEIADHFTADEPVRDEVRLWFLDGHAGSRIVALGLVKGARDVASYPFVESAIEHPRSAFEQYTALVALQCILGDVAHTSLPAVRDILQKQLAPERELESDSARRAIIDDLVATIDKRLRSGRLTLRDDAS